MIAILHDIRSIYNVASIFRTADGLGVGQLYLSGHTPTPIDRFGRKRNKFSKVALGAEDEVAYKPVDNIQSLITSLKKDGVSVIACEPNTDAKDYRNFTADNDICLVFGNEPNGLPKTVIEQCDDVIKIPMQGMKSSLNVSVAFGIISAHIIDKTI